jgi:hypothetical protein
LKQAVEQRNNNELKVRLSEAIDPSEAHAIDVLYHSNCWSRYVTNARRSLTFEDNSEKELTAAAAAAAEVEFLNLAESVLRNGNIVSMIQLEKTYNDIRQMNGVIDFEYSRKKLKHLLIERIQDIDFSKPIKVTDSERVSLKCTTDRAVAEAELNWMNVDKGYEMSNLYSCAKFLRGAIMSTSKWKFDGSMPNKEEIIELIPSELYCFLRWLITGPVNEMCAARTKTEVVNERAMTLAQSIMFSCLSNRQTRYDSSQVKKMRELPLQLAVGITIHHSCRSRKIIDMLSSFSLCRLQQNSPDRKPNCQSSDKADEGKQWNFLPTKFHSRTLHLFCLGQL